MVSTGESTATWKPYQSILRSLRNILHGSPLYSLIQYLNQCLLKSATLENWVQEMQMSEIVEFSMGCFRLMTISELVEALPLTSTKPTYLSKCFWYYGHHHQDYHHQHYDYGHYTMDSITISPGLTVYTYTHYCWAAGSRFCQKIWVGDLLSPRSNFLTFLQYLKLQFSTPWPGHIVRSCWGGCIKD
jgi:hypothetical protein